MAQKIATPPVLGTRRGGAVAYVSPDGKLLVTASGDGTARIWDLSTREELLTVRGHTGSVQSVAFSPAGGLMAVGIRLELTTPQGDFVTAARNATPETINFMAKHARGLICLALTPERCEEMQLPQQAVENTATFGTAFTVSIDARKDITTGISAADRATTVLQEPQRGTADAVRIANDVRYGLMATVWTGDPARGDAHGSPSASLGPTAPAPRPPPPSLRVATPDAPRAGTDAPALRRTS